MKEFLLNLLSAVLMATIPVCTAAFVTFIKKKNAQAVAQTDNIEAETLSTQVCNAICVAVSCVAQTYVNSLKKQGTFDIDAQKEALQKALTIARAQLSESVKQTLTELYGDLDSYLTSQIEAEVLTQKGSSSAMTSAANTAVIGYVVANEENSEESADDRVHGVIGF